MHDHTRLSKFAVATATALACIGCSAAPRPFTSEFPDLRELVTTSQPAAVRERLDRTQLPDTPEHHERLRELLRDQATIDGPHLVLLLAAIASDAQRRFVSRIGGAETTWAWPRRGVGAHAGITEQLLNEALPKLVGVDRRSFGELIGRSQTDATMVRYCERFLAELDDGSEHALLEMLAGMLGSPATMPFVDDVLDAQGRLAGARGWAAFGALARDDDRIALLRTLVAREPAIDGERLLAALRTLTFEEGREQAFSLLAPKFAALGPDESRAAVATFLFDDGRQTAFATLGRQSQFQLDEAQLTAMARLCLFDSGRLQCLQALAPRLTGMANATAAAELLRLFGFDKDRLRAVELLAPRWRTLTATERTTLVHSFVFDDDRRRAEQLLGH